MVEKGVFGNGVPYIRLGKGETILLVFSGGPGNTLPSGFLLRIFGQFKHLIKHRLIYMLSRKTGLPKDYTTRNMAEDYATIIRDEFDGGPIDVMGMSYGGLIAQHLVADHPELIQCLIIAMSCYHFSDKANEVDMRFAELLSQGKKRAALSFVSPD